MRMSGWEDFVLPLMLVFAIAFALTLRHQIDLPSATPQAMAAQMQPDFVMTITAKRLPAECRNAATRTPLCASLLAREARVEMREAGTRLADRTAEGVYGY